MTTTSTHPTTGTALRRWRVYSGHGRDHLCVALARDAKHALAIARQNFHLPREAFAVPESPADAVKPFRQ